MTAFSSTFRVATSGQTLVLASVKDPAGTTIPVFSDTALTAAVTLPYSFSADTSFYSAWSGVQATVVVQQPDGTALGPGGSYTFPLHRVPGTVLTPKPTVDQMITDEAANIGTFQTQKGAKLRRAAAVGLVHNSLDLGVMTSPPTITTSTTNPDATLTQSYLFTGGQAASFKFRGGTPYQYASIYYQFPVVSVASGGNVQTGTKNACGFAVEFYSDAPKLIVFMLNSTSTNGVMIEVNDQPVAASAIAFPATSGGSYFLLDFTTAGGSAPRKFRVEADLASGMRGVYVGPTYTVWAPADEDPVTAAVVGDSVTAQTGVSLPNGGYAISTGKMLGWTDVREIALGGTGWVNPGSWASTFGDANRVADVVAVNPDVVVFTGSSNDAASSQATITAAVLAGLTAYRAVLPSVPFILTGIWAGASGPSAAYQNDETAVKAAFTAFADPNCWYIDMTNDPVKSWVFGTGHVGATNGSGNSDIYVGSADTYHPGQTGHTYLARRLALAIRNGVLPNIK